MVVCIDKGIIDLKIWHAWKYGLQFLLYFLLKSCDMSIHYLDLLRFKELLCVCGFYWISKIYGLNWKIAAGTLGYLKPLHWVLGRLLWKERSRVLTGCLCMHLSLTTELLQLHRIMSLTMTHENSINHI